MLWEGPARAAFVQLMSDGFRLVCYDMRGMGMSSRDVTDFSIEAQMADIDALRERLALESFALCGVVHATPACIAYAVEHPERLTHLILDIPFACGEEWYQALPTLRGLESFREMGDEQWELYTLAHATTLAAGSGGDPQAIAQLMRASTTPGILRQYFEALRSQDVTPLLDRVRTPCLILQVVDTAVARFALSVASAIPGARLTRVAPDGRPGGLTVRDADLLARFVLGRDEVVRPDAHAQSIPARAAGNAVILFLDIADSTALTERMGDAAFRAASRALDEELRAAIRGAGGAPVEGKVMGDGVMATFGSAREAIDAALRCNALSGESELRLHIGVHAGDVIREPGNVYGGAVNIAARICDASAAGEVLVSDVVRGMARTSAGVSFEDRGEGRRRAGAGVCGAGGGRGLICAPTADADARAGPPAVTCRGRTAWLRRAPSASREPRLSSSRSRATSRLSRGASSRVRARRA
jgi:class 3 adenylate cyclase